MRTLLELTDQEITDLLYDQIRPDIVRSILMAYCDENGYIDENVFAEAFAQFFEDQIEEEPDSDMWAEAYNNNYDWGYSIIYELKEYLDDE